MPRLLRLAPYALTILLASSGFSSALAAPDWPEFRGPGQDGDAGDVSLPTQWSESENVTWKTPIPHSGWSTPVVHDGRIWLTSATEDGQDFFVYCVDAADGKVLHEKKLFHSADPEPLGNNVNCYASPSPAIEDGRVYVHFGSYGTACLDTATAEVLWERTDLECRHYRGPGSSVLLYKNLAVLTFDGVDQQYTCALDKATGETVWKTPRSTKYTDLDENGQPKREGDFRKAYSTPIIIEADGKTQMITFGSMAAFSLDPETGAEIWKITLPGYSTSARPIADGNRIYASTGYGDAEFWAFNPAGSDADRVAWRYEGREAPQTASPILVDGLVYTCSNRGAVTCFDAATGEEIWSDRIGGSYMASPIHANGLLYFPSSTGNTTVLKAGRTFEVVSVNELEEGCMASPAVAGEALILRTKTHLYRIED